MNPLIAPNGKAAGTNVGRGGTPLLRYPQETKKADERPLQRELPAAVAGPESSRRSPSSINIGNQHYTYALNNRDPRIDVAQQNAISTTVDNPFYNYLTPALFPGPLRNQKTVSARVSADSVPAVRRAVRSRHLGAGERYHSLEFKAQKAFSKGWNFLGAYVYIREKTQTTSLNELDTYRTISQ